MYDIRDMKMWNGTKRINKLSIIIPNGFLFYLEVILIKLELDEIEIVEYI